MSELLVINELFGVTVFLVMDLEDLLKLMLFTHQYSRKNIWNYNVNSQVSSFLN